MGIADSIITLAFGVPLIGVALAIGLAFGMGGRDAAAKQLDQLAGPMKEVDQKLAAQAPERLKLRRRLINRKPDHKKVHFR